MIAEIVLFFVLVAEGLFLHFLRHRDLCFAHDVTNAVTAVSVVLLLILLALLCLANTCFMACSTLRDCFSKAIYCAIMILFGAIQTVLTSVYCSEAAQHWAGGIDGGVGLFLLVLLFSKLSGKSDENKTIEG